jgi:DNA-binding response OmpR family regulator
MPRANTILVVDDESEVRTAFRLALTRAGYRVIECDNGEDALATFRQECPALIILDVDMPRRNGWETLEEIRRVAHGQPILMITDVNDVSSRVRGLTTGADDYVGKPCTASELVARVKALLRRVPPAPRVISRLTLGPTSVDLERKVVERNGAVLRLTRTESQLLTLLVRRPGVPVTKDEIIQAVWDGREGCEHTLDTHVWRLRRKLDDVTEPPRYLLNHPGIGFSLQAESLSGPGSISTKP